MNLDRHDGANRVVLKAMVNVAHKLGIHTLCEGMETEEQKEFLKDIGCELAQGFLYHRPEGLDTIFDRLNIGIPIPKWESSEERIALEKKMDIYRHRRVIGYRISSEIRHPIALQMGDGEWLLMYLRSQLQ